LIAFWNFWNFDRNPLTATIEQQVRFDEQTNKCYPLFTIKDRSFGASAELFETVNQEDYNACT